MTADEKFMKLAISLAKKGDNRVLSNPKVGAVVVNNGEIVGKGFHKFFGGPHAEVYAIKSAKGFLENSTIYVTLEPCSHFGKTPPCVDLIIASGIKRVVIGTLDLNPLVSGQGVEKLKKHGIDVLVGVLENECKEINRIFFKYITKNLPYVFLKSAITLDGKIATSTGDSKWITNEDSRKKVLLYRKKYQSILTGINTVLLDDPLLSLHTDKNNPTRFILDPNFKLPINSNIVKSSNKISTFIFTSDTNINNERIDEYKKLGLKFIFLKGTIFSMKLILKEIAKLKISSVMVEAGGNIVSQFFKEKLIDEGSIFIAPKILGDSSSKSFVNGFKILKMKNCLELNNVKIVNHKTNVEFKFRYGE